MRQIAFRQVRKFSRLFSWNPPKTNEVGRPTCNGNLNSHIVPKTAINVNMLYKCSIQTIYNDEGFNKYGASNKAAAKNMQNVSMFILLIKWMKTRLNEILNKITSEPQCIIEFLSWKIRELLLTAIIATGVSYRDTHSVGAPDSHLHRCTCSFSAYAFSRHPKFCLENAIKSYLARKTPLDKILHKDSPTLGVSAGFLSRSFAITSCAESVSMEQGPCDKFSTKTKGSSGSVKDKLVMPLCEKTTHTYSKVTVVGIGQVGMAAIISMLTQGVTNQIVMIDTRADKLEGEALDILHGSIFVNNPNIQGSTDYAISEGSKICIICAGVRQRHKETRLDLVQRNTEVLKKIIPELVKYIPDAIYIVATNPVDILTCVAWKISGLPKHRMIGSGTLLDSARFRYLIAQRLGIATTSVDAYIIGEHGNSMVPVWSGVNIAGVRLRELNPSLATDQDPENWNDIHSHLIKAAYNVRSLKGFTSWAIGLSITRIVYAMLTNSNRVFTVSTFVQGMHEIEDEVFLSLPAVLGHDGVGGVINQALTDNEKNKFQKSAKLMAQIMADVKI